MVTYSQLQVLKVRLDQVNKDLAAAKAELSEKRKALTEAVRAGGAGDELSRKCAALEFKVKALESVLGETREQHKENEKLYNESRKAALLEHKKLSAQLEQGSEKLLQDLGELRDRAIELAQVRRQVASLASSYDLPAAALSIGVIVGDVISHATALSTKLKNMATLQGLR